MDKIKIFLDNSISCEIDRNEFEYMRENNIVQASESLYYINPNSDFFYLFNKNTAPYKKNMYISQLSNQNFVCSVCGKEHSYNISPYITSEGEVDFKKIICCCKACRLEKLKKRDIVVPIYKQQIDWKKEKEIIKENVTKYNIKGKERKKYIFICKKIIIFNKYKTLVLPKRNFSNMKDFNREIDMNDLKQRWEFKQYLYNTFNKTCPICGKVVEYKDFTIDHVVAKSLGGKDNVNNFIGMCETCNKEKDSKTVLEFLTVKELKKMPTLMVYIAKNQQDNIKKELTKLYEMKNEIENKKINVKALF